MSKNNTPKVSCDNTKLAPLTDFYPKTRDEAKVIFKKLSREEREILLLALLFAIADRNLQGIGN